MINLPLGYAKVVIIGAGPVGLFSVFTCGMMGLSCCVVDTLNGIGGQCRALYPEKPIYDIPAFPSIVADDLIMHLETQIAPMQPTFYLGESVLTVDRMTPDAVPDWEAKMGSEWADFPTVWCLGTSMGRRIFTLSVIVCAGGGALIPKRPPLEDIEPFEGKSVFYHVTNQRLLEGKRVVIAGGGDSAVDWAIMLANKVHSLHMVHRRTSFRAQDVSIHKLQNLIEVGKIVVHAPYQLKALHGDRETGSVESVEISHLETQESKQIEADYLLPFFGIEADMGAMQSWGLKLEKGKICTHPTTGESTLPGIYAAGDISIYPYKHKLIVTGWGEAAHIAHHLRSYLFPEKQFRHQYSTTQGVGALRL